MLLCALDVSKGYADIVILSPDDAVLHACRLDDLPAGHASLHAMLREAHRQYPDAAIRCGAESTGGLEYHWLLGLRSLARELPSMEVFEVNPLAVSGLLRHDLHRAITDAHSARGIALYLRLIAAPAASSTPAEMRGVRMLLGVLYTQLRTRKEMRAQLQAYLPLAFPELVRYCRDAIPLYVLHILEKYPSPAALARARLGSLTAIPFFKPEAAKALHASVKQSVTLRTASEQAPGVREDMEFTLQLLARELLDIHEKIKTLEQQLIDRFEHHPAMPVLVSITGVGAVSAAKLIALLGNVARFPNVSKLVAYLGLDPMVRESGDMKCSRRISKRGSVRIRCILYQNALTAVQQPGPLQDYYQRLRAAGKHHMVALVACMNKLLRIIYACWLKEERFDPTRNRTEENTCEKQQEPDSRAVQKRRFKSEIIAPVSAKEAKRRLEKQKREEETLPKEALASCS